MLPTTDIALQATRRLRQSPGWSQLSPTERHRFDIDLRAIERSLRGEPSYGAVLSADPYAAGLETPDQLRAGLRAGQDRPDQAPASQAPARPAAPRPPGTEVLGERARNALEAVDFPAFVAGLVEGTFQAIVDASAQQVRQYAELVASLAQSVGDFSRHNVSDNQARDHLVEKHPESLTLVLPAPGEPGSPRVALRRGADPSPEWLAEYGLAGEDLSEEAIEGPLLDAARRTLAEARMQTLATMVLMGINRVVVEDGEIKARMLFHARARERVTAEISQGAAGAVSGIAARSTSAQGMTNTLVSTVSVNAQADVGLKAELMGEVAIRFRTETFDLDQFATTPAIQLINGHARPLTDRTQATNPQGSPPAQSTPNGEGA